MLKLALKARGGVRVSPSLQLLRKNRWRYRNRIENRQAFLALLCDLLIFQKRQHAARNPCRQRTWRSKLKLAAFHRGREI